MNENCDRHLENLKEYSKNLQQHFTTKKISFFNRDIAQNFLTIGYIETLSLQDSFSFVSEDENDQGEKYETLEMSMKQMPKRNALSSISRNSKYQTPITLNPKINNRMRCKSIISYV